MHFRTWLLLTVVTPNGMEIANPHTKIQKYNNVLAINWTQSTSIVPSQGLGNMPLNNTDIACRYPTSVSLKVHERQEIEITSSLFIRVFSLGSHFLGVNSSILLKIMSLKQIKEARKYFFYTGSWFDFQAPVWIWCKRSFCLCEWVCIFGTKM